MDVEGHIGMEIEEEDEEYISESEEDNDEEYIPDYEEDETLVIYISESEGEDEENITESEEEDDDKEYIPESEEEEVEEELEELVFEGEEGEDIMESDQEEEEAEEEEQEEVEQLEEMKPPFVTGWVGPDGVTVHGIMCIDDGIIRLKNQCQLDDCPICYKPSSTSGEHQICCLPCGHTYGLSCIKQWLILSASRGKCPKCKTSCSFQDVRLIYPHRLCVTDHRKASSTTLVFPFTEQGSLEFEKYEYSRMFDAELLLRDDIIYRNNIEKKHLDLVDRKKKLERKEGYLLMRVGELELEERAWSLVEADDFRRRASLLIPRINALKRRTDALEWLASALRRRIGALEQRYESRMGLYQQMYKEHETKKNNNEPCTTCSHKH